MIMLMLNISINHNYLSFTKEFLLDSVSFVIFKIYRILNVFLGGFDGVLVVSCEMSVLAFADMTLVSDLTLGTIY